MFTEMNPLTQLSGGSGKKYARSDSPIDIVSQSFTKTLDFEIGTLKIMFERSSGLYSQFLIWDKDIFGDSGYWANYTLTPGGSIYTQGSKIQLMSAQSYVSCTISSDGKTFTISQLQSGAVGTYDSRFNWEAIEYIAT